MTQQPPSYIFATLGCDDTGNVSCAFWRRGLSAQLPPLMLVDLSASSVADLDAWLPAQAQRLAGLAGPVEPAPQRTPWAQFLSDVNTPSRLPALLYAPMAISAAVVMRGVSCQPLPDLIETMPPEARALRAAAYVTGGAVQFSPETNKKMRKHPYNAIRYQPFNKTPSAVASAFALGILLVLAPESQLKM